MSPLPSIAAALVAPAAPPLAGRSDARGSGELFAREHDRADEVASLWGVSTAPLGSVIPLGSARASRAEPVRSDAPSGASGPLVAFGVPSSPPLGVPSAPAAGQKPGRTAALAPELESRPDLSAAAAAGDAPSIPTKDAAWPVVGDAVKPAVGDAAKPAATEAPKLAATDAAKPAPSDAAKPAVGDAVKPAVGDAVKPATPDARKPAPSDAAKPAVGDATKPAAGEAVKPAAGEAVKPAVGEAAKPAVPEAPKLAANDPAKPLVVEAPRPPKPAVVHAPTLVVGDGAKPAAGGAMASAALDARKPAAPEAPKFAANDAAKPAAPAVPRTAVQATDAPAVSTTTRAASPETIRDPEAERVTTNSDGAPARSTPPARPTSSPVAAFESPVLATPGPTQGLPIPGFGRAESPLGTRELSISWDRLGTELPRALRLTVMSGGRTAVLHLQPPELGTIRVQLELRGADLTTHIETERPEVAERIERLRGELERSLESVGIRLDQLHVESRESRAHAASPLLDARREGQSGGQNGTGGQQGSQPRHHAADGDARRSVERPPYAASAGSTAGRVDRRV